MSKVVVSTYVTLDGVIESPEKWSLKYFDDEAEAYANDLLFGSDALLLGRGTYEGFAEAWPSRGGDFADRINSMPKYVVSRTLDEVGWNNSTLIQGDVADEVAELKQQQDLLIYGAGELARTLMQSGLIDEHHIWVTPVAVGSGERLFQGEGDVTLELVDTTRIPSGSVILKYGPA
jgi:dihydrofolate reductase